MRPAYGNLTLVGCGAVAAGRLGNATFTGNAF